MDLFLSVRINLKHNDWMNITIKAVIGIEAMNKKLSKGTGFAWG